MRQRQLRLSIAAAEPRRRLAENAPRILSPYVIAEADYLIHKYGGVEAELLFIEELARGAYFLAHFDTQHMNAARELVTKYRDLGIGIADASIAVIGHIHDCHDVLTLDLRHFRAMRLPGGRRPFRIYPADL